MSAKATKRGSSFRSRSPEDPNAQSLMQADQKPKEDVVTIAMVKDPKTLWKWFIRDPMSRWQLLFFVGMFILCIILIIVAMVDPESSFTTAGVGGLIVSAYGAFHFKTLMALREEVDSFERKNTQFKKTNAAVRIEVDKLDKTKDDLETSRITLEETLKKNKENLIKFQTISKNLELMGQQNIKGLSHINDMTRSIGDRWREELIQQERKLYVNVFEQLELKDSSEEMSKDEYDEFLQTLPPKYRLKIQHHYTFEKLAGDNGTLSFQEFGDLLDQLAKDFATTNNPLSKPSSPSGNNGGASIGAGAVGGDAIMTGLGVVEE